MRFGRRVTAVLALVLSAVAVDQRMPAGALTTNDVRDNPAGTVGIIKVTATDQWTCSVTPTTPTTCSSQATVTVDMDSNDPNTLVTVGSTTIPRSSPPTNEAGQTVYLWWLQGSTPADVNTTDCTRATDLLLETGVAPVDDATGNVLGRTLLGSTTFSSTAGATFGKASISNLSLPPNPSAGGPATWSYGVNWLCATTAMPGGAGAIGDLAFTILPGV